MVRSTIETGTTTSLEEEKLRARAQWSGDPCGAESAAEQEFGTREFFDGVQKYRYTEYAPWMPELMGFGEYAGARLLEVGCGMGSDLLQFARGGALCTGLDLTPRSIEITRHRFTLYGEKGDFLLSDGERLPFSGETFDVVYSNGVLHHTPDTVGAVRELHRVLRKGGTAKVMLYHRNSLNYWVEIVLRRGLLKAEFLRGHSAQEIMSRCIEYSEHGGQPLVKVYSRNEARKLFRLFREIQIEVAQLTRSELRIFQSVVSEGLFKRLEQNFGWNLIITAKK